MSVAVLPRRARERLRTIRHSSSSPRREKNYGRQSTRQFLATDAVAAERLIEIAPDRGREVRCGAATDSAIMVDATGIVIRFVFIMCTCLYLSVVIMNVFFGDTANQFRIS